MLIVLIMPSMVAAQSVFDLINQFFIGDKGKIIPEIEVQPCSFVPKEFRFFCEIIDERITAITGNLTLIIGKIDSLAQEVNKLEEKADKIPVLRKIAEGDVSSAAIAQTTTLLKVRSDKPFKLSGYVKVLNIGTEIVKICVQYGSQPTYPWKAYCWHVNIETDPIYIEPMPIEADIDAKISAYQAAGTARDLMTTFFVEGSGNFTCIQGPCS